jgi:hypothetical protein
MLFGAFPGTALVMTIFLSSQARCPRHFREILLPNFNH